ncbi:uncharacterized protein LOC121805736 [Salvia splendens]|uniref:uncharacterized protein LOC121805736 n=1 Tax=Salvia splendens TaxID=180675 RepID=UPI001C2717C2|nr:uncharacterized protein LOC121805736 [Salvia splendens]
MLMERARKWKCEKMLTASMKMLLVFLSEGSLAMMVLKREKQMGRKMMRAGKPGMLADGEESTEVNVQESADSMDETPDFVAENKENCDVNAESMKGTRLRKPSNDSIAVPASSAKET